MSKIPYDGFNPLQNLMAWMLNSGLIDSAPTSFMLSIVAVLTVVVFAAIAVDALTGDSSRDR